MCAQNDQGTKNAVNRPRSCRFRDQVPDFAMGKDASSKSSGAEPPKKKPVTSDANAGSSTQVPQRHKKRGVDTELKKGLTSSGIRKVARRAAVGNIAAGVYSESRDHLDDFLHNVIYGALRYVKARNAKRVTRADIASSFHNLGIEVV